MRRFEPDRAELLVFTYKAGLLSSIAHDLRIRVTRFWIEADSEAPSVRAEMDADSLHVETAMRNGRAHSGLDEKDKREIEGNIRNDVLDTRRHPKIRFTSTRVERIGDGWRVEGDLELGGATRPIRLRAAAEGDLLVIEHTLHQPDWGIRPYRAALGTLRVQADVKVRVSLRRSAL